MIAVLEFLCRLRAQDDTQQVTGTNALRGADRTTV
jgi:hypothetical protein